MKILTGEAMSVYATLRTISVIALCGVIAACASVPEPKGLREGTWTLYTEGGEQVPVEVTELRDWEYRLNARAHPISGVYVLEGDQVIMTRPDNPRMKAFVWRYRSNTSLLLIDEPSVELSGMRLTASELLIGP